MYSYLINICTLLYRKLEHNWEIIKFEGLSAYTNRQGYLDEAESLRDTGDWKQFELFARGLIFSIKLNF